MSTSSINNFLDPVASGAECSTSEPPLSRHWRINEESCRCCPAVLTAVCAEPDATGCNNEGRLPERCAADPGAELLWMSRPGGPAVRSAIGFAPKRTAWRRLRTRDHFGQQRRKQADPAPG